MRIRTIVAGLLAAAAVTVAAPAAASAASFGVPNDCQNPVSTTCWVAGLYNHDYTGMDDMDFRGAPAQDAGGHPFTAVTDFEVNTSGLLGAPVGTVKQIRVDLPPGLISNPQAVPTCGDQQITIGTCPGNTQLGVVELQTFAAATLYVGASVYNAAPEAGHCPGSVADFAFETLVGRIDICGSLSSSTDDHLYFTIATPQTPALVRSTLIFWGVPGDTGHNPQRGWSCDSVLPCTPPASGPSDPQGTPFISNPSGCVPAGQITTLTLTSYQGATAQATSPTPVPAINCATVPFSPSLTVTPQTTQSDAPTALSVDLRVPQNQNPAGQASAMLKDATVTLPPGLTLDPSAARGLRACTPAQFGKGSDAAPSCPAASQIGTVQIDTPLLAKPLSGSVFLGCDGSPASTPCPAKNGLADLFLYASGQGVTQKLVGAVTADPQTGRLTATFSNQPQVPFSSLNLSFRGGATAPVANPLQCGKATTTSALTPYSGNPPATPESSFTVDANGAGGACASATPFTPGFALTPATPLAGAFDSPLTVVIARAQQQQYLSRVAVTLPPGLIGLIARVPLCPAAQAATGACPAASRIGATTVLAGSGANPISVAGNVYLTGPYNGGQYGLAIVVPAIAGPFNLGTVVVRAAIRINRYTAKVTVTADPLPQVVGGVPLRIRSIDVAINRPGFIVNPTNCSGFTTAATLGSAQGAVASASSPFQATNCGALSFAPTLRIRLTGKGQTTSGKHPTVTATVTSALGQANIRATSVTLPKSLALDPNNSMHVCSVAASNNDRCPRSTIVGTASVDTPILPAPLSGKVYLVQGIRTGPHGEQLRTLPVLLVTLRGAVAIDLRAQTSVSRRGQLVTTFRAVPDVAISRFQLRITGGRHGLLVVTGRANLCHRAQIGRAKLSSQSGKTDAFSPTLALPCPDRASVSRPAVRGHKLRVAVTAPAAGKVTVGGPGLLGRGRRVARRATISFALGLTTAAARRLGRRGSVRVRVRVRYTRSGHAPQTIVTHAVRIRRAQRSKR